MVARLRDERVPCRVVVPEPVARALEHAALERAAREPRAAAWPPAPLGEIDVLHGTAAIAPPYSPADVTSTNEIVLVRLRELVAAVCSEVE